MTGNQWNTGITAQSIATDALIGGLTAGASYKIKELMAATGPYKSTGGHHIHTGEAYRGNPAYSYDDALSISDDCMTAHGWNHRGQGGMTTAQRRLYAELARNGEPNTMAYENKVAYESLRAGGAPAWASWVLVQKSAQNLVGQGVYGPIKTPWH